MHYYYQSWYDSGSHFYPPFMSIVTTSLLSQNVTMVAHDFLCWMLDPAGGL